LTNSVTRIISLISLVCLATALFPLAAHASGPNRTALVVIFGDGRSASRCIAFEEPEISSHDVLQRSGLNVRFSGYGSLGAAICAIEGEGCPREDQQCFCQCLGTPCLFWTFWLWRDGQWHYSQRGASNVPVDDGELQAWFWSDGQSQPSGVSFDAICLPPPTETPAPADTPRPTEPPLPPPPPTVTPLPTPVPTDTPAPAVAPTHTQVPAAEPSHTTAPSSTQPATTTFTPTAAPPLPSSTATQTSTAPAVDMDAATPQALPTLQPSPTRTSVAIPTPTSTPSVPTGTALAVRYGTFALLAATLLGGFWWMRQRQGAP
jgi:hypothetical protein